MSRLVVVVISVILVLMAMSSTGCTNAALSGTSAELGQGTVSGCINCHTDKDMLKAMASHEEEAVSEATSGEG